MKRKRLRTCDFGPENYSAVLNDGLLDERIGIQKLAVNQRRSKQTRGINSQKGCVGVAVQQNPIARSYGSVQDKLPGI